MNTLEKLQQAIMEDCKHEENKLFNEDCQYCRKYQWILKRAQHYSEKTGIKFDEIIEEWESNRSYWYMNFYQDSNQPLLDNEKIVKYDDWISELKTRFGEDKKNWTFKCVMCGENQSVQDFIDNNIEEPESKVYYNCIGRYVSGRGCNWSLGGLFTVHKMSVLHGVTTVPVFEMAEVNLNK